MPKYPVHYKDNWLPKRMRQNSFCYTFVIEMNAQYFKKFHL